MMPSLYTTRSGTSSECSSVWRSRDKPRSNLWVPLKSMRESKNRYFYHIFVSPGDAPEAITRNVVWMEREFDAYKLSRSMYSSTFNSFRVIRCLSQCVSPKIAIFTTFLFPLGPGDAPGAITLNVTWIEREFNAYKLPRCMCPSIYNRF